MEEIEISPGAFLAWRIAAVFALESGSPEIEPLHFLFGICNMAKAVELGGGDLPTAKTTDVKREVQQVSEILSEAGVDLADTLGKIKILTGWMAPRADEQVAGARPISRSAASRKLFDPGTNHSGGPAVDVQGLLTAICKSGGTDVIKCLRKKAEIVADLSARFRNAGFQPSQITLKDLSDSSTTELAGRDVTILDEVDAGKSMILDLKPARDVSRRFSLLCDVAWEFGTEGSLDAMLQRALDEMLRVVPAAEHGQILVRDPVLEKLYLKAHSSGLIPLLSMSSVHQAIAQKKGFIWRKTEDLTRSQSEANLEAGLYVPLVADGEVFGIICLENSRSTPEFRVCDLQLANGLAHQLGLAIANHELRRELKMNVKVMERLMTNFSPQVRSRLLQRARLGRLQLGGERATVSIICADIRGFTTLASKMEAEDVVELLNDYFPALSSCVFQNDGTINDFVGDAIMAVFGSPEENPNHSVNALKAAVQMQQAADSVSASRSANGKASCEIGIGVHCGDVVHGFIGSTECMEYTVVGDTVNFSSRYSACARGGEVLLSPEIHQRVWEHVHAEKMTIETKHEGKVSAYRVIRLR
jgi:adenylate cyclase